MRLQVVDVPKLHIFSSHCLVSNVRLDFGLYFGELNGLSFHWRLESEIVSGEGILIQKSICYMHYRRIKQVQVQFLRPLSRMCYFSFYHV